MKSIEELIKEDKEIQYKYEIKNINNRILTSMSYLSLVQNEDTERLYMRLKDAYDEILVLEEKLK